MTTKAKLLAQAELAEMFAHALPVGDVRGFCEAMIDAKNFRAQAAKTELTPAGEQFVIPGCERNASPKAKQLGLFG